MRFRPANIRLINRRPILPRPLLALSLKEETNNDKDNPDDVQRLTGSLHIRSLSVIAFYAACSANSGAWGELSALVGSEAIQPHSLRSGGTVSGCSDCIPSVYAICIARPAL